ncbi:MAG: hypothetical protein GX308_00810 [Epulopiscium sp.]|nr:hypothetical protein [Candidatus Epulonipiscium sp.]
MNRWKRGFLFCLLFTLVVILSGCGAQITSNISIDEDGKGTKTVYAYISSSDLEYVEGGINALEEVLTKAKPDVLTMSKEDSETAGSGVQYVFTYSFDSIDDYNKKTEAITGKPHDAIYVAEESLFGRVYRFEETNPSYDLVKWATDAVDASEIISEGSGTDLFDMQDITVDIPGYSDSFYNRTANIKAEVDETYPIKRIEINTFLDFKDTITRELKIIFDSNIDSKIGQKDLKDYFHKFCNKVERKEESGEGIYTLLFEKMTTEQLTEEMNKLSKDKQNKIHLTPSKHSNTLHPFYNFDEDIVIDELLKGTYVNDNVMYRLYYPRGYEYSIDGTRYFNGYIDDEKNQAALESYYSGEEVFSVFGEFEKRFYMNSIDISVKILNNNKAEKSTKYIWNKYTANEIGYEELDLYFKELHPQIKVMESGQQRIYEDVCNITKETNQNSSENFSYYKKTEVSDNNKDVYLLYDSISFNSILGGLGLEEGINYDVYIPNNSKLKYASGNRETKRIEKNTKTKTDEDKKEQLLQFRFNENHAVVKVLLEKTAFPIVSLLILGLILFIGMVVIIALVVRIKRKKDTSSNQDELS